MIFDSSGKWILVGRYWIRLSDGLAIPFIQGGGPANTVQNRFAFGDDDGSESGHTLDTENANRTAQVADVTFLIRIQVEETAGKDDPWDFILRAAKNGGSYTDVTAARTDGIRLANDTQSRSDNEVTTERLTAGVGSWLAGYYDDGTVEDGMGSTLILNSQYTDLEFAIEIDSANAANDDYWDLRVYDQNGTALDGYTNTSRVIATGIATVINLGVGALSANGQALTVDDGGPDPGYYQHGFRIRSGDTVGLNVNSGWAAGEDTGATIGTGMIFRVRFALSREGTGVADQFKIQAKFNAGSWADVDIKDDINSLATCIICLPSSQFADAAAATQLLGTFGKSWTDGEGVAAVQDTGNILTASQDLDNLETEHEFCLMIKSFFYDPQLSNDQVQAEDKIELRLVESDGTIFPNAYTNPVITVSETAGFIGCTSIEGPGRILHFDGNGNIYVFAEDNGTGGSNPNRIAIKSANRGSTWREMDASNRPTQEDWESGDIHFVGDVAYIGSQLNNDAYHDTFNLSTHGSTPDTWGTIDEAVQTGITRDDQVAAIIRRSDGSLVVFFQEQVGGDFRLRYKIKNGSWGSVQELDATGGANQYHVVAVLGASDRIHIFYNDNTAGNLYHKSLSSGDSLGARDTVSTDVGTGGSDQKPILGAVYYDPPGAVAERIVVSFKDESSTLVYTSKIDDDGSPSTPIPASDNTVFQNGIGSNMVVGSLVVDRDNLYIIYADDTNQEIWIDKSEDYGAWGTDTKIIADVVADVITAIAFEPTDGSLQIGILYEDDSGGANGFGWYKEYEQRPATTSIALGVGSLAANGKQATIDPGAAGGVQINLFVGSMAANGQALDVVPGTATVSLGIGSLSSNGQALNVVPGLASISLGIGALTANGQQLDIIPGLATISLAVGALAAGGQQLDVIPGQVSISLGVGALAANGKTLDLILEYLFNVTHDANNLNEYDDTVTDGGDLSTNTPGLANTTAKMTALIDDAIKIYGQINLNPPSTNEIRLRYYIDPNSLTMASGNDFANCRFSDGVLLYVFSGNLRNSSGNYTVRIHYCEDAGYGGSVDSGTITDAEHYIEIHCVRSTSDVANNGYIDWWVDDNAQTSITGIDNWDLWLTLDNIKLGAIFGIDYPDTQGTFYLDELQANETGNEIGGIVSKEIINLGVGSLSANGQILDVQPGPAIISLAVGSLNANGQALQVLPGLVAITMQVGSLGANGQGLNVIPGLVAISLQVGSLNANGQQLTVDAGVIILINLGVGQLSANGQALNVIPGLALISLQVGSLGLNGQILNVVPGAVTIGLAVGALVINGQTLVIVTAIHPDPDKVYYSHYREKRSFVQFDGKSGPVGPTEKRRL